MNYIIDEKKTLHIDIQDIHHQFFGNGNSAKWCNWPYVMADKGCFNLAICLAVR